MPASEIFTHAHVEMLPLNKGASMASTAKLIPILSRRNYVPDRPRHLMAGAVMAAYHIFDELAPEVPASELLSRVRKAIIAASSTRQGSDRAEDAADIGTARAMAAVDKVAQRVLSSRPASWCDVVAIAELAAFHAGARAFDDIRKAFDVNKPHERFAAELILTVLGLAAGGAPEPQVTASADTAPLAYVYLAKSGPHFKIGRTASLMKRKYALAIQLPDRLEMLHTISTDDPAGVEQYWHKRFSGQRKNGEWFTLSDAQVAEFKTWTATARNGPARVRVKLRAATRAR